MQYFKYEQTKEKNQLLINIYLQNKYVLVIHLFNTYHLTLILPHILWYMLWSEIYNFFQRLLFKSHMQ